MGRRVFYAEPKQPGEQSVHPVDFGPAMVLAGEKVPSDNSVSVTVRERESAADVTASMFVGVTVDEQAYRYNHRGLTDSERFDVAVAGIVGKRVTFDELTGKASAEAINN